MRRVILVVDDDPVALAVLSRTIWEIEPSASIADFTDSKKALDAVKNGSCTPDIVFLDVEMDDLTGVTFAKNLKDIYPNVNILFVTGYSAYMEAKFLMHASGYLLKPIQAESIKQALMGMRVPAKWKNDGRLHVQCFGDFEVFYEDESLCFVQGRAKELFAYLVDRCGASCSMKEIAAALLPEETDMTASLRQLRQMEKDLSDTLTAAQASHMLNRKRGELSVRMDAFSCDYYGFLNGDVEMINAYYGEYMRQYAWARFEIVDLNAC